MYIYILFLIIDCFSLSIYIYTNVCSHARDYGLHRIAPAMRIAGLRIVIEAGIIWNCPGVPHTPASAAGRWSISQYQPPGADLGDDLTVLLGNNDLHYVWLAAIP